MSTAKLTDRTRAQTLDFRHKPRSLWGDAVRRFSRNFLAMISLAFIIVLLLVAIFAGVLAPEGYDAQDYGQTWLYPSWEHPMGTDPFGRDVLTRIIYGARISLAIGFISNFVALAIGLPYGAISAWYGGVVDYVLMRIIEIVNSVPNLLLGILIMSILGNGFRNLLFVFIVTGWMGIARLLRGQFLSLREQDYVLAATCIGATNYRIITRHLLPNSLPPIIIAVTLGHSLARSWAKRDSASWGSVSTRPCPVGDVCSTTISRLSRLTGIWPFSRV